LFRTYVERAGTPRRQGDIVIGEANDLVIRKAAQTLTPAASGGSIAITAGGDITVEAGSNRFGSRDCRYGFHRHDHAQRDRQRQRHFRREFDHGQDWKRDVAGRDNISFTAAGDVSTSWATSP
jgi:hypothetical protein